MLPRRHRLSRQRHIRAVLRAGRRHQGVFMTVRRQASNTSEAHITFVVSRRVDKRATVRNKIKRRLRSVVAPLLPTLQRLDLVVVTHPAATKATFSELKKELQDLLHRTPHDEHRRRPH